MNQNYDPTRPQQQQGNPWDDPFGGNPLGAYSGGGGLAPNPSNYALWSDRVLAALIDGGLILAVEVVLFIIVFVIGGAIGMVGGAAESGALALFGWGFCCIGFFTIPVAMFGAGLYNKVFLLSKNGGSIGQGMMKLKVVDANGNFIPTGTAFLRLLVQVGFSFVPFLPLLSILFPLWDPQRQTLHDKAVNTFVIKTQ